MKFTEEQRLEIKDAILIRCSGTDYQTFQIEEIDRMVDEIESLIKGFDIIDHVSDNEDDCNIIPDECPKCGSNSVGVALGENECFDCQYVWL